MSTPIRLLISLVSIATVVAVTGCAGHPRSDKLAGEVVVVELTKGTGRAALAPLVAGALAGAAVDALQSHLEAEAAKLERQFGASVYRSDFWTVKKSAIDTAKYEVATTYNGFKIKRYTRKFPKPPTPGGADDVPAMEFEAEFQPSDNGRLFLIQPKSFITREAKAKVVNDEGTINSTVSISVDAMWVDKNQVMRQERIATASFDVMNYALEDKDGEPAKWIEMELGGTDARVGWFPGVPVSTSIEGGKPLWETADWGARTDFKDGAFKLTVNVIEKDSSKSKEYIERAAKYVGEQREKLVEKAKGAVE